MRILVTGMAGFLGRHVAAELCSAGHDVTGFDLREVAGQQVHRGDLGDLAALEAATTGMDCVCHLGGVGDVYLAAEDPPGAARANVVGTANVAESARRNGCRVVYASTWEVYGRPRYQPIDEEHPCEPDHPYNITKLGGEQLLLAYDRLKSVPVVALRLGTAFGLGMRPNSVFSVFISRALNGQTITIDGTGAQSRQFTHASDIARAFRLAAESSVRGVALNIVASESTSIRALAEQVVAHFPTHIEYRPARAGDVHPAVVSSDLARKTLGWEARTSLADGLVEMIGTARSQHS